MSKKVRVVLNRAGVRELLRSDGMKAALLTLANERRRGLGDGYEVTAHRGKNRVNASIRAATERARRDNLKNNTLLKAIGGRK